MLNTSWPSSLSGLEKHLFELAMDWAEAVAADNNSNKEIKLVRSRPAAYLSTKPKIILLLAVYFYHMSNTCFNRPKLFLLLGVFGTR